MADEPILQTISEAARVNPPLTKAVAPDQEVSFIPMADVSDTGQWTGRQTRRQRDVSVGYTPFEERDVLFAKITPCMENGKGCHALGLVNGVGYGSTEFHVLRAKPGTNDRFLYFWSVTDAVRKKAETFMIGSAGQQRVQASFFDHFRIPRLDEDTQAFAARVLDAADEAIAKTDALIAKLKAIKQGLLHDLLTRGLDDNGELSKEQPNSLVPISGMAEIDPPLTQDLPKPDNLVSFLPMTDVSDNGTWTGHQRRPLREVCRGYTPFQNNDVLFAKITPCMENGKGCHVDGLVNGVGFGSTEFFVLRSKPGFSARFIFYWTVTPAVRRKAAAFMIGSAGQQRVKRAFFDKFEVPLLAFAMQEKIVAILDVQEARIRQEQEYLEKLKSIKKGLMQDLLTGQVRVGGQEGKS